MEHIVLTSDGSETKTREYVDPKRFPAKYKPLHWGQLKLLIYEIGFFSRATDALPDAKHVVYAGAAPGTSMKYVASLFPSITFTLYDPAEFDPALDRVANIVLKRERFTAATAAAHTGCIFMSDIRSGESEDCIVSDMKLQLRCAQTARSVISSFKFRLPFSKGTTSYPDGPIFLQAFAPVASTETRLEVSSFQEEEEDGDSKLPPVEYDHKQAEGRMAFYNQELRNTDMSGTEVKITGGANATLASVFKGHLDNTIGNDAFIFAQAVLRVAEIKKAAKTLEGLRSIVDEMWAAAAGPVTGSRSSGLKDYLKLR